MWRKLSHKAEVILERESVVSVTHFSVSSSHCREKMHRNIKHILWLFCLYHTGLGKLRFQFSTT